MAFSERKGLKPTKKMMQKEGMSAELRTALWNCLIGGYWRYARQNPLMGLIPIQRDYAGSPVEPLVVNIWASFFKRPLDTLPQQWDTVYKMIRTFFFKCEWNEVYDFIEFVMDSQQSQSGDFVESCNAALGTEFSAYRLVGGKFVQVTEGAEMVEIGTALESPIDPVRKHLKRSLELLSNREEPDYRNSIKESISAVESMCVIIAGKKGASLADALSVIETKIGVHGALRSAFGSLYGYTSSTEGIRHAMLAESKLDLEDAVFMLGVCSAFVNYLFAKSLKAGVKLS